MIQKRSLNTHKYTYKEQAAAKQCGMVATGPSPRACSSMGIHTIAATKTLISPPSDRRKTDIREMGIELGNHHRAHPGPSSP